MAFAENLLFMGAIEKIYTNPPFLEIRKMGLILKVLWYNIGRKRAGGVRMRMGLKALYQKPRGIST